MSTEIQGILAIPESVVVGTGSYTIPANKYAYVSMTASSAYYGNNINLGLLGSTVGHEGSASANNNSVWLVAGNTLANSSFHGSITHGYAGNARVEMRGNVAYSRILINGVVGCVSYAGGMIWNYGTGGGLALLATGEMGWTASIFPIPKNNLPTELIV